MLLLSYPIVALFLTTEHVSHDFTGICLASDFFFLYIYADQTVQSAVNENVVHCINSFANFPMDEINQIPIKLEMNLSVVFNSCRTH